MLGVTLPLGGHRPRAAAVAGQPGRAIGPARTSEAALVAEILAQAVGRCTLISGPSGSGKSSLLLSIHAYLRSASAKVAATSRASTIRVIGMVMGEHRVMSRPARRSVIVRRAAVDCAPPRATLDKWLATLARAGLADATALLVGVERLSAGQQARLQLARAMYRAERATTPTFLIIDEFASVLDRPTAVSLAMSVERWAAEYPQVRVILATAHHDLGAAMPQVHHIRLAI